MEEHAGSEASQPSPPQVELRAFIEIAPIIPVEGGSLARLVTSKSGPEGGL